MNNDVLTSDHSEEFDCEDWTMHGDEVVLHVAGQIRLRVVNTGSGVKVTASPLVPATLPWNYNPTYPAVTSNRPDEPGCQEWTLNADVWLGIAGTVSIRVFCGYDDGVMVKACPMLHEAADTLEQEFLAFEDFMGKSAVYEPEVFYVSFEDAEKIIEVMEAYD